MSGQYTRGSGLNHADGIARIAAAIVPRGLVRRGRRRGRRSRSHHVSVTQRSESVQDGLTIVEATGTRLVKAFVELPYRMYAADPHWIPELRRDAHRRLSPRHNPVSRARRHDAVAGDAEAARVCGRIAAIEDHAHNEFHHERLAWFGFFEAEDAATRRRAARRRPKHGARARGVLDAPRARESVAERKLRPPDRRLRRRSVPADAVQPADLRRRTSKRAGFAKVKDLLGVGLRHQVPLGERIARMADRVEKRHDVTVRHVNMRDYDADLDRMVSVYRAAWEENWGFVPPTDAEMKQLATDLKPIVDPDLVLFAEIGGRTVACVVAAARRESGAEEDGRQAAAVRPVSFSEPPEDHHTAAGSSCSACCPNSARSACIRC